MYKETYRNLYAAYHYDNFEVIAHAINKHFSDIFKLDVLEFGVEEGSYSHFFQLCMEQLGRLYTLPEVIKKLNAILDSCPKVRNLILNHYIFVPSTNNLPSAQISFLEKLATRQLRPAEPLTYLDMVRLVHQFQKTNSLQHYAVVHIQNLLHSNLRHKNVLFVNFNQDPKGTAKWGVVDLRGTPAVYCETPLTEEVKSTLENAMDLTLPAEAYVGGQAAFCVSTGYTALAWYSKRPETKRLGALTLDSDFSALLEEIIFLMGEEKMDVFCPSEAQFFTKSYNACKGHIYEMARACILGELNHHEFEINNLCLGLDILASQKGINVARQVEINARSFILALDAALQDLNILEENGDTVKLTVPNQPNMTCLREAYSQHAKTYVVGYNSEWLDMHIMRKPGNEVPYVDIATAMVLSVFRGRAKKHKLDVTLPNQYQLDPQEQGMILKFMRANAYVTNLQNQTGNESLEFVRKNLLSTFARNRWLANRGYKPPMVDDYWKQAAKYWVLHLPEVPDVLLPKAEHDLFKGCVREMGLQGLDAVLRFLKDESEIDRIERVYGKLNPPFYAACQPSELADYLNALIQHLRENTYFPFSELGIAYQPGNDDEFIRLLELINGLGRFDKITLTDCLTPAEHKLAFKSFLQKLTIQASGYKWVGLVVIPELKNKDTINEEIRDLRSQYEQLNNVIVRNRHALAANETLQALEKCDDFELDDIKEPNLDAVDPNLHLSLESSNEIMQALERALQDGAEPNYPLKKSGEIQLQFQQQEQIQQTWQVQQEQQTGKRLVLDEVLSSELVGYDNIDRLLGEYFADYEHENALYKECAQLKRATETCLQGFFHTWVNANPQVVAPHVISKMTLEAAKVLIRKHRLLSSGLNPDNLPKGFFTRRNKDGHLILYYSPEVGYAILPNPLTMDFDAERPEAEAWEGDFRQFNLNRYLTESPALAIEDWQNMILFAALQPVKDYKTDFDAFCWSYSDLNSSLRLDRSPNNEKILAHWVVFLHAWHYAGEEGVRQFLSRSPQMLRLTTEQTRDILLLNQSQDIKEWAHSIDMDAQYLRAIGQIYYRYGDEGVKLFLKKLRQIDEHFCVVAPDFFRHFNTFAIRASSNFNCFMSETFFTTMNAMMKKLGPATARGPLLAWKAVYSKHMEAVKWEPIEKLWDGFEFFIGQLLQEGLELKGNEFDAIPIENMLVCMDRILAFLRRIAHPDHKRYFLDHLNELDRTHGGVFYALEHEGFKDCAPSLHLSAFEWGSPTYAPNLKEIYAWDDEEAIVKMRRTIASEARFTDEAFKVLFNQIGTAETSSKHQLMWLLHTQYQNRDIGSTLDKIKTCDPDSQAFYGKSLYCAVYQHGNRNIVVQLNALLALEKLDRQHLDLHLRDLIQQYPDGTLLEAMSILWQSKRWKYAQRLVALFADPSLNKSSEAYSYHFYREGFKLAALFGVKDAAILRAFYDATHDLLPVVQIELRFLLKQLLSVNYETTSLDSLVNEQNQRLLLTCIKDMKNDPSNASVCRVAYMKWLTQQGIDLRYAIVGNFRMLDIADEDSLEGLGMFIDHRPRIWAFLLAHIAIPTDENANKALQPIIRFFKVLQFNRTYLNEIEPLLSSLEKTKTGKFWSSRYFYGLLCALQPENDKTSFPISLLKVMLDEELIAAKILDSLDEQFPSELSITLQIILKHKVFDRKQQVVLCQIALKEFNWNGSSVLLDQIKETLAAKDFANSRSSALAIMAQAKGSHELAKQFNNCRQLLAAPSASNEVSPHWTKTRALWLKALAVEAIEKTLFNRIRSISNLDKQAQILHIIAWSSLDPGLRDMELYDYVLDTKTPKLIERLALMDLDDLLKIARCYPLQPSPGADDLLRFIKKSKLDGISLDASLAAFLRRPFTEPRGDYSSVALTRAADLQRMIVSTQVSNGEDRAPIPAENAARLTLLFAYLKRMEAGHIFKGMQKSVPSMTQAELSEAFQQLSLQSEANSKDDLIRAQIWAILFEALGRTTRKYPHLAQQFALIANDICVDAPSRVLQLSTGEGKSHFVALRAARAAGLGKTVDVCTAKRTLAERDLSIYHSFFRYLGLTSAYIHPKTPQDEYVKNQIHYLTMGDISLFLDEQSNAGNPIVIPPERRIGLFDEFDFIRFGEGCKTSYNYARPTGKTPKQMTWFYQDVNQFYRNSRLTESENPRPITWDILREFLRALLIAAGENEEKQSLIKTTLARDPLQLVQWLQSAEEAHALELGVGFTVSEENIEVGDESYPMREIIPLSSDNEKMVGSTFSAGVQQLLAVCMNTEARDKGQPQNFHIHPESNIISSQVAAQRMKELWGHWEGFTGTISVAQAETLYREQNTQVLHVATNQRDLRVWKEPQFFDGHHAEKHRRDAIVKQIRRCFENKQSMLFACKNDKLVAALETMLRGPGGLTEDELANFVFYSNEVKRLPHEILDDKRKMEKWHRGKKNQAVGLVASVFGRGDNVDVQAVFLLDVTDTNDQLQKGGRTARNGAEGEVFQFYLANDLFLEEQVLFKIAAITGDDKQQLVDEALRSVGGDGDALLLKRVMLLREYVFSLQNAAKQGFHNAKAQLSTWSLALRGKVNDQTLRKELGLLFSFTLKILDKKWIRISSQHGVSAEKKVAEVEKLIIEEAGKFSKGYCERVVGASVREFQLAAREPIEVKLVVRAPSEPSDYDNAVASICGVMLGLPDLLDETRAAEIPRLFAVLAGDKELADDISSDSGSEEETLNLESRSVISAAEKRYTLELQRFAHKTAGCQSTHEFIDQLELAVENLQHPSEKWIQVREAAIEGIKYLELLEKVNDDLREEFDQAIYPLLAEIKDKIIEHLCAPSIIATAEARLLKMMPVIHYLGKFSRENQRNWGLDYINQLDNLLFDTPKELLLVRLDSMPPMSYGHFNAMWNIAKNYALNTQEFPELLALLAYATERSPEQRVRQITKWEGWSSQLSLEQSYPFLRSFCKVMGRFEEGKDWDILTTLVNKTQYWWNISEGKYQREILLLWERLEIQLESLPKLNEFCQWCMGQHGKSWFQLLSHSLTLPAAILVTHQHQIQQLWDENQHERKAKKKIKTDIFINHVCYLEDFYHYIESLFNLPEQTTCKSTLLRLDAGRFKRILELKQEYLAMFDCYPHVFLTILGTMGESSIKIERINAWSKVLAEMVAYQTEYPSCNIDHFKNPQSIVNVLCLGIDAHFNLLMDIISMHKRVLSEHPRVFSAMMDYMQDSTLTYENVKSLTGILLHVGAYQTAHAEESNLLHLLADLGRFVKVAGMTAANQQSLLSILLELCEKNTSQIPALFSDNIAFYLLDDVGITPVVREQMMPIVALFYQALKEGSGDPIKIMQVPVVKALFEFNKERSPVNDIHTQRMLFMHLLNQQVFVQARGSHSSISFDLACNEGVLTLGFDKYVNETRYLLEHAAGRREHGRDLNRSQQQSLLRLTDEMVMIGKPQPNLRVETPAKVTALEGDLQRLSNHYRSCWFKSAAREHAIVNLQTQITTIMNQAAVVGRSHYETVLQTIHGAKLAAITMDIEQNTQQRTGWLWRYFKLNRSGGSRYYDTLSKMEDNVKKSWAADQHAIQHFQVVQEHTKNEFKALASLLASAVEAYSQEICFSPDSGRGFFGRRNRKPAIEFNDLVNQLNMFVRQGYKGFQTTGFMGDAARVTAIVEQLRAEIRHFPGHIRALIHELLARGDSLALHLGEQEQSPDLPGLSPLARVLIEC